MFLKPWVFFLAAVDLRILDECEWVSGCGEELDAWIHGILDTDWEVEWYDMATIQEMPLTTHEIRGSSPHSMAFLAGFDKTEWMYYKQKWWSFNALLMTFLTVIVCF